MALITALSSMLAAKACCWQTEDRKNKQLRINALDGYVFGIMGWFDLNAGLPTTTFTDQAS
jgi:hypothetical protein